MKVSQIVALSATLALQAQACVRVRVDTLIENGYNFIQEVKLYDNDNPVVTHGKVNFRTYDDENLIRLGGYNVKLQYKDRSDGRTIPYGGRITYPNGPDRDLQGKDERIYEKDGKTYYAWCFTDNYDNCGNYACGVN